MTKKLLCAAVVLLVLVGAGILWLFAPMTFAYYRDFNLVRDRLERIPSITIVGSWKHEDVILEDFGFALRTPLGNGFQIDFWEGNARSAVFDRADGVVVHHGGTWKAYDFGADGIFRKQGNMMIRNAEELLRDIDAVLGLIGRHAEEGDERDWGGTADFVHIWYPLDAQ
jgi:hypothetical protein